MKAPRPQDFMATEALAGLKGFEEKKELNDNWRRQCGCLKTSEKLKELLKFFPTPPPPTPLPLCANLAQENTCASAFCTHMRQHLPDYSMEKRSERQSVTLSSNKSEGKSWGLLSDFVHVVQMSVMATALAFYYIIYCYMQMIYYTLRSALFFHNADGTMKITIGVVTLTSLIVGFNLIARMERILGVSWWKY